MISFETCVKKLPDPGQLEKAEAWEIKILQEMAMRHLELASSDENKKRIAHWKEFHALKNIRPPVLVQYDHTVRELPDCMPACQTKNLQPAEHYFNVQHWHFTNIRDDFVINPWIAVKSKKCTVNGTWGIEIKKEINDKSGSWRDINSSFTEQDLPMLTATPHQILDGDPPLAKYMREYLGGILPVHINRSTAYRWWNGVDISETLIHLFGYEGLMVAMYDEPELLHAALKIIQAGIIKNLDQVKAAGDWAQADMYNHAMLPTEELPDAAPGVYTSNEKDLWFFMHAQEFDPIGPALYEDFMFQYQLPIMERFGLIAYGCCESLVNKMYLLRRIPNLRRVCVGPTTSLADSAAAIERDYIVSWRPGISLVTGTVDFEHTKKMLNEGIDTARNTHLEIIAKDIMGFGGDVDRLIRVSELMSEAAEKFIL